MTTNRLDQIEARAKAATDGPWKLWAMDVLADPVGNSNLDDAIDVASTHMLIDGKPRTFDAEFIAHARTDVPDLMAFVRDVAAELEGADDWDGLNADAVQRMQGYLDRLDGGA